MQQFVFASHNPNKVKEIRAKLGNDFEVLSLQDINFQQEIPEDFETLEENALQKARTIKTHSGKDCFADDTGLEVEALNGAPGVYSARYAGLDANSENNINKLLKELDGIQDRKARFRTSIALLWKGQEHCFEGIVEGRITETKSGTDGFGYDPVFIPNGYDITFAEMSLSEKNQISHRGRAFAKMTKFLSENL